MANKTLTEYLSRFEAEGLSREILESAGDYKCSINRESKYLKIAADFP
jgi:hypothetical protein